jgi:hypothetical protein
MMQRISSFKMPGTICWPRYSKVVKLIDVYPESYEKDYKMGGRVKQLR